MKEIWATIEGYEHIYKVSNLGRVKRLSKSGNSKLLTKQKNRRVHGYEFVRLSNRGIAKQFLVHRLVAKAFIPNPYNLPEVNHIDTNKMNNTEDNLEWCTHSDNMKRSTGKNKLKGFFIMYPHLRKD